MFTVKQVYNNGLTIFHSCVSITMYSRKENGTREILLIEGGIGKENVEVHLGPENEDTRFCQHIYIMNSSGRTVESLHADAVLL